ncbi:MAG: N-acetylmuramoyl-L-alanine amidase, partial [Nitrospinota bacterium]
MLGRRELLAGALALLCQPTLLKKVFALPQARVLAVRHWAAVGYTRVVIDVSQRVRFSGHRLRNPERVYVDISPARLDPFLVRNPTFTAKGLVRRVRTAQNRAQVVRVALDVEGVADFRVFSLESPFRIVVDLRGGARGRGKPRSDRWPPKKEEDPRHLPLSERFRRGLGTIVLDPGHGGKDPGAIGPRGLEEKVVVLDVGKNLASLLKKALPGNRIILTRSADRFLPLEERTALANTFGADVFMSIHANASPRRNARGIETYLL